MIKLKSLWGLASGGDCYLSKMMSSLSSSLLSIGLHKFFLHTAKIVYYVAGTTCSHNESDIATDEMQQLVYWGLVG